MTEQRVNWRARLGSGLKRAGSLIGRGRREREFDEEIVFHLDMLAEQYEREGMSREAARSAARRNFGPMGPMKESYRRQRGVPVIETMLRDLRYAVRNLRSVPAFTVTVVLSLALGIGANSAVFSVVNSVLLRPLPYPESDDLVQITRQMPGGHAQHQDATRIRAVVDYARSFDVVAATGPTPGFNLVSGDGAEYVRALSVSSEYFQVLGVSPMRGRPFTAEEDVPNGPRVAIVSHALWSRLLGSDPTAIGRSVTLSDVPYTIVGILPESFRPIPTADLLIPLGLSEAQRGSFNFQAIGRLAPGVSLPRVREELASVTQALRVQDPEALNDGEVLTARPYAQVVAQDVRPALLILVGAVGVVLLIACANTASLLLARATSRGREMSVRAALGASRGRITGQLLTEGLLLSAVAGALGLAFAWWAAPALLALSPAAAGWRTVQLDTTVVLVTAAISLGTGVLFGLVPLLTVRGTNLTPQLRDDGTRTTQSARTTWLRRVLVTAEVALAVVLLVSAGLLVRTFDNLRSVDLGFEPHGLLTAQMSLSEPRFRDAETTARLFQSGLDRITRLPRVEAAAVVSGLPVERGLNVVVDIADAPEPIDNALTDLRYASSGYFAVMRIPVLAGRVFDDRDAAGAPSVAIVNREFARRLMPDGSPLGRHVQVFSQGTLYEIVGVVDNVQEQGLGGDAVPVVYLTVEQVDVSVLATAHYFFQTSWVVRTRTTAPGLAEQIRDEIRAIDPRQPFSGFRPMNAVVDEALLAPRFHMVIMAIFSGLALVLAVAGIYGVMTYSVTARMRDIGIRMAIGASRHRVVGSVLGQAAVLAAVGIALGLAGAVFLTRMLETFVFGVSTSDMKTFVAVAGSLLIVAVLASAIPALRAATVDPVQTLRAE